MGKAPLAAAALLLAACSEAGAQNRETPQPEAIQVAALTTETKARTMAECRVLADKAEKIACMTAARDALRVESAQAIASKVEVLETERETGQELDTTIEGLTKGLDIAEALQAEREQQER